MNDPIFLHKQSDQAFLTFLPTYDIRDN